MIVPIVVAGLAGFLAAGRSQPRTRCERKVVLGARTGRTYEVEEFPQAGFLVVRAPDGGYGVFQHATQKHPGDPRFSWRGGKGPAESLHGMCADLGLVELSRPAAPAPKASQGSQGGQGSQGEQSGAEQKAPIQDQQRPRPTAVPSPQKTGS